MSKAYLVIIPLLYSLQHGYCQQPETLDLCQLAIEEAKLSVYDNSPDYGKIIRQLTYAQSECQNDTANYAEVSSLIQIAFDKINGERIRAERQTLEAEKQRIRAEEQTEEARRQRDIAEEKTREAKRQTARAEEETRKANLKVAEITANQFLTFPQNQSYKQIPQALYAYNLHISNMGDKFDSTVVQSLLKVRDLLERKNGPKSYQIEDTISITPKLFSFTNDEDFILLGRDGNFFKGNFSKEKKIEEVTSVGMSGLLGKAAFHPLSQKVIVSVDNNLHFIDVNSYSRKIIRVDKKNTVSALGLYKNENKIIYSTGNKVFILDLNSYEKKFVGKVNSRLTSISIDDEGKVVLATDESGNLLNIQTTKGKLILTEIQAELGEKMTNVTHLLNHWLITTSLNQLYEFNVETQKLKFIPTNNDYRKILKVEGSKNGWISAISRANSKVEIRIGKHFENTNILLKKPENSNYLDICLNPAGDKLLTFEERGIMKIWRFNIEEIAKNICLDFLTPKEVKALERISTFDSKASIQNFCSNE